MTRRVHKPTALRGLFGFGVRRLDAAFGFWATRSQSPKAATSHRTPKAAHHVTGGGVAKHIFVTGGVVSSLGKGLTCASIGMLLEHRGLRVRLQKFDPYINVDPGTMSPYQHGEVYVLDDGSETDLDLGHYERFTNAPLSRECNYTTGKIYLSVIEKERHGDYLGRTVQVIPHVTDEIKSAVRRLAADDVDVVITEIGGTVRALEGPAVLRAIPPVAPRVRT